MGKGDFLGAFEELVLLAIVHAGREAYGMTVRREIEERTGRSVSIGAVYATLDRLEGKGYLASRFAEGAAVRRGRAKRFFRLEPTGAEALTRARRANRAMWDGADPLAEVERPR